MVQDHEKRNDTLRMRMLAIIAALVIFNGHTYSQDDTTINNINYNYISVYANNQIHKFGNYIVLRNKEIKDGHWIVYDEDGEIIEKGSYEKGKKTGKWEERGRNGECCWSGEYVKGRKEGLWTYEDQGEMYKHGQFMGSIKND